MGVLCGIIHTAAKVSDLVWDDAPKGKTEGDYRREAKQKYMDRAMAAAGRSADVDMDFSRVQSISPECNLLGQTTDEAIYNLDKYLDDARLSHLETVRIVHGKGTGALRKAVQEYLRKQDFVKSFRAGEFGEGDAGVTIVTLKK